MFMPITPVKTCSTLPSTIHHTPIGAKRVMDVALVLLLIPLALPLLATIAGILLLQGRAVFYSQMRVGRDGRMFRLWKFRTMVLDAGKRLESHLLHSPDAAREWHTRCKLRDDPRVTRFGAFLRKSSLDELPQLWNVLCGQMSLVGPRPVTPAELTERYRTYAPAYLKCRPGMTGLWQVSGRNSLPYSERVQLDAAYAKGQNLWLDFRILWRTVGVVLRGTGY